MAAARHSQGGNAVVNLQNVKHAEILRAAGVSKVYPDGNVRALSGVNLAIRRGEYLAIVGPSGSGKSTLLNLLGLLDEPSSGEICFDGQPITRLTQLDRVRARKIGFVFQSFHLLPMLTAVENVQVPMFEGDLGPKQRAAKAAQLLAAVGLEHRAHHLPLRLSVGERQRVAIARALANDPVLLLADEPTGNLDSQSGAEILELFARLHRSAGITLVVITHSAEVAAQAQRVISVRDGRIESDVPSAGRGEQAGSNERLSS
ncbi:MAG: ABC transporter ATP-binding protein [Planctomycetaceae bacterium]|nr:ABC transporter ATP-binding protein [Planctomycetaceae bacterium]